MSTTTQQTKVSPSSISVAARRLVEKMSDNEATDLIIYGIMAKRSKSERNRKVLQAMSFDESLHRDTWMLYTDRKPQVSTIKVYFYTFLSIVFGLTFTINLMEKGEESAQKAYEILQAEIPEAAGIRADESRHEEELMRMIEEHGLSYISSIVLGLNDALVELTGALAGFTLALNDNTMIGLAGFITGVAATLSMAASEYLAKKADPNESHPLRAATYTGLAYVFTVTILLMPYAVFTEPLIALFFCLCGACLIIAGFTYFVSVVRHESFFRGFFEMVSISFGVALLSFLIGWGARVWLNL